MSTPNLSKSGTTEVTSGANKQKYTEFGGKTIGEVRKSLKTTMNIADDATPHLDGNPANDSTRVPEEGDHRLEFIKAAGSKG